MAIIRDAAAGHSDRAHGDRTRHRQLVEDAIKHNLTGLVAEEDIIGERRDKKIKVPVKGVKEFQFVFGRYRGGAGAGAGQEQSGQTIGRINDQDARPGMGGYMPGTNPGEEMYETEITVEDLINYLFDELELPDMERKRLMMLEMPRRKRAGYQRAGIPPRLAKRRTLTEKIRREQSERRGREGAHPGSEEAAGETEQGPFHDEDIRFHRIKDHPDRYSNAVVICIMDASGSMDQTKKYLARSFYFLLCQFVRRRYEHVEIVYISHTSEAREVNEHEFFHRAESGGTVISSGYRKALDIIEQRYNPSFWNIYLFHTSDGDNWGDDNPRAVALANELCRQVNLFGYGEINTYRTDTALRRELLKNVQADNFVSTFIARKQDIWPAFRRIIEKDREEGEEAWESTP